MTTKGVQVRFTNDELNMLDTMAQESTRNRSDMLRHLIKQAWKIRLEDCDPQPAVVPMVETFRQ